ncbi:hypothetical protein [Lactiplantibacillus plantarum]|uniref:hypothetical protein n=1 Tax=Lactiplantibacillus plantarum TaxID=1590 RepID=UPI0028FC29A1|nr:hypothetical protein [Lactiplantibacillus plantarum]WNW16716.1 hypothetical protein RUO99_04890 [Lactiplantibacillus plantarum]WNW19690.1 hypothetical protein RUP00_04885 [Lactiplantibacillus plantarum]
MFGRKDKYKSIEPDQPRSEAPTRSNSIQPKKRGSNMFKNRTAPVPARGKHSLSLKPNKVVKDPDNWFEHGGFVTFKNTANTTNQPHVRIEFDDIADTPKVFIDGVERENVQRINLSWNKSDDGCYQIEMIDDLNKPYGIGQCKSK